MRSWCNFMVIMNRPSWIMFFCSQYFVCAKLLYVVYIWCMSVHACGKSCMEKSRCACYWQVLLCQKQVILCQFFWKVYTLPSPNLFKSGSLTLFSDLKKSWKFKLSIFTTSKVMSIWNFTCFANRMYLLADNLDEILREVIE